MKPAETQNYCTLYLVRHGETEWNIEHITQGHLDSALTEKGIQQAEETADEFKGIHFDAIFSSDSLRAQRTAEVIKLDRDIIIQTSELLRERCFGSFEGKHGDELLNTLREKLNTYDKLPQDESWAFELAGDIETDESLITRFINKLREISVAYPGKTVLVVSHGGPIRMFLLKTGYAGKKDLSSGSFKNAGYVKVASDGVDFVIKEVTGIKKSEGGE